MSPATTREGAIHGNDHAHEVYIVPVSRDGEAWEAPDYWSAVTDVPCPVSRCRGVVRWAEAGRVPGYRICDGRRHHRFLADGTARAPELVRDDCCEVLP